MDSNKIGIHQKIPILLIKMIYIYHIYHFYQLGTLFIAIYIQKERDITHIFNISVNHTDIQFIIKPSRTIGFDWLDNTDFEKKLYTLRNYQKIEMMEKNLDTEKSLVNPQ